MKLFIISLLDYDGESIVKFVDEETWNWIHQPYMNDEIPSNILTKIKEKHVNDNKIFYIGREEQIPEFPGIRLGEKTYRNDRAFHAPSLKEENYFSLKEKLKIIKELELEGYQLTDEFNGHLY